METGRGSIDERCSRGDWWQRSLTQRNLPLNREQSRIAIDEIFSREGGGDSATSTTTSYVKSGFNMETWYYSHTNTYRITQRSMRIIRSIRQKQGTDTYHPPLQEVCTICKTMLRNNASGTDAQIRKANSVHHRPIYDAKKSYFSHASSILDTMVQCSRICGNGVCVAPLRWRAERSAGTIVVVGSAWRE